MHDRPPSEAKDVEYFRRQIHWAGFFRSRRALRTDMDLAVMCLVWIRKVFRQARALPGHLGILKLEVGECTEIKDKNEEAVTIGTPAGQAKST